MQDFREEIGEGAEVVEEAVEVILPTLEVGHQTVVLLLMARWEEGLMEEVNSMVKVWEGTNGIKVIIFTKLDLGHMEQM